MNDLYRGLNKIRTLNKAINDDNKNKLIDKLVRQNTDLLNALKWVQDVQKRNYGRGMDLHLDMLDFPRKFDILIQEVSKDYHKRGGTKLTVPPSAVPIKKQYYPLGQEPVNPICLSCGLQCPNDCPLDKEETPVV